MGEILIEQARRKATQARRPGPARRAGARGWPSIEPPADDLLALDEAIQKLQAHEPRLAEIVMLRYYTGLSVEETAGVLGESSPHGLPRLAARRDLAGPRAGGGLGAGTDDDG